MPLTGIISVRVRTDGNHWHLPDCDFAQFKDYKDFNIKAVLSGEIVNDEIKPYIICPGCLIRIKNFFAELRGD